MITTGRVPAAFADMYPKYRRANNYWELPPGSEYDAQRQEMMAAAGAQPGQANASNTAQQGQADDMFGRINALTQGRADELRNDPVNAQLMKYLQGIINGQDVPYNDQTINALKAQNGRGTASAEQAQMESLRQSLGAGGGSIYDPSYQAASREMQSERQGRNLDYAGQLDTAANAANFGAKQQATGQLANVNANQNSMINNLYGQAAGYQAQRFMEQPSTGMPTTLMPQYSPQAAAPAAKAPAPTTSTMKAPVPTAPQAPAPTTSSAQVATQPTGTGQRAATSSYGNNDVDPYIQELLRKGSTINWA